LVNRILNEDETKAKKLLKELDKYSGKLDSITEADIDKIRQSFTIKEEIEKRKTAEQRAIEEGEMRKIAEQKTIEAEEKRKIAEQKTVEAEEKRKAAEQQTAEAEERRKTAEQQTVEAEEKRKAAEQKIIKEEEMRKAAEQKTVAEEEMRKIAEQKAIEEEEMRKIAEQKANEEKIRAEAEIADITAEKEKLIEELKLQIGENLFLKNTGIEDSKILLKSIRHNINHSSERISKFIRKLVESIERKAESSTFKNHVEIIGLENQKILTFSRYVDKVSYNTFSLKITQNIVDFIQQYLQNIYPDYTHDNSGSKELNINFNLEEKIDFSTSFNPVELTLILDNLVTNSYKAKARTVDITWKKLSDNELEFHFKDDGKGISDTDINRIFDFGFSTTRQEGGTGLGLHLVKQLIEDEMKGKIIVNNKIEKGVEFIITFSKR
jgi:signal transduction histidine kinase